MLKGQIEAESCHFSVASISLFQIKSTEAQKLWEREKKNTENGTFFSQITKFNWLQESHETLNVMGIRSERGNFWFLF